jgi:hypothetical protein
VLGARGEAQAGVAQRHALAFDPAQIFDGVRVCLVRRIAGHGMIQRGTEAENVAAVVLLVFDDLFGGHIVGRGPDLAGLIAAAVRKQREPEVHHLGGAGFGEEDVRRFHIAMDQR